MMKILLVQPPIHDFYHTGHRMYPLGLMYLASSLKKAGFSCRILDAFTAERPQKLPIPPSMNYLEPYYSVEDKSPFRLFGHFYHFGLGEDQIRAELKDADLIGVSALFTPYEKEALIIAQIAKELGKLVVLGGNHATVAAEHLMENSFVDYVIYGEAEKRLVSLVEAICGCEQLESIDGLAFRLNNRTILRPPQTLLSDLDNLPFPDRSLLNPNRYQFRGSRYTMILASRGCPYSCRFCSGHAVMGSKTRFRSIENILAEMRLCYEQYQIKVFDFEDENFTYDKGRAIGLLEAIEEEFGRSGGETGTSEKRSIRVLFENGLFPHSLDREIMERMKKLGCYHLNLPLVSSSNKTLKRLHRPGSSQSFARCVRQAGRDFFITGYLILGLPGSDLEEMVASIRFLAGQRVLIAPSIFYATPGMALYDECQKKGWLPGGGFLPLRSCAFPIQTDRFQRLDLVTLFRLVRALNFIKSLIDEAKHQGRMKLSEFIASAVNASLPCAPLPGQGIIKFPRSLSPRQLGLLLLSRWLEDTPTFYRVQKEAQKRKQVVYRLIRQPDSEKAWKIFLEMMNQTPIWGLKNPLLSLAWEGINFPHA